LEPDSIPYITVASATQRFRIRPESIDLIARTVCAGLGLDDYEVSWDFVDTAAMRELNNQFRSKDRSTDVLSFPQEEWLTPRLFQRPQWPLPPLPSEDDDLPPQVLGDVVISPADALQNAENIGHNLDRETCFLLVHGILHLCGHDHMEPEEERLMIEQQKLIMEFLETVADRPLWADCISLEA
jgi:probable rRNA maturation factor